MHYFLLGPSGVGKTYFGNWLQANRQYLHILIDRPDEQDGLDVENLREPWNKLKQGNPAPFADELQERAKTKKGCVLTFWSIIFCPLDGIKLLAKHNIAVKYLYGPKKFCIKTFVDRDKEKLPKRDGAFWHNVNPYYEEMGADELAPYRADAINSLGERLSPEKIAKRLGIS